MFLCDVWVNGVSEELGQDHEEYQERQPEARGEAGC